MKILYNGHFVAYEIDSASLTHPEYPHKFAVLITTTLNKGTHKLSVGPKI